MVKILSSANASCPCCSGVAYGMCCGLWHAGFRQGRFAPTPEALMRSRYSAYVLKQTDYLLATWHPSTAPGDLDLPMVDWKGLEVLNAATNQDAGVVEFVAKYKENGRALRLHEVSRFTQVLGRWLYIDGHIQTAS